jgi:hypothetical protein
MQRKNFEDWFIIPDAHIPYHNKPLLRKLYGIIKEVKPYGVAIIGDWIDLHSLGTFSEGKTNQGIVQDEYDAGFKELENLDSVLPKGCKKVYIEGNHEHRSVSWLNLVENDRLKKSGLNWWEGLKLAELGYHIVHDWKNGFYVLGSSLELIHGVSTAPFAAKVHLDRFQGSVISGHAHTLQHYCTNKRGSWVAGGLFNINNAQGFNWAARSTRERWSNGFAYVIINGHGFHHVHLIHSFQNRFIFGSRLI